MRAVPSMNDVLLLGILVLLLLILLLGTGIAA